jgi:hypothetical protein
VGADTSGSAATRSKVSHDAKADRKLQTGMMNFASVLKGRVAESVLIALLERSGYRITRLGVEVLIDEVKHLDLQQYQQLNLPAQLRSLPDLLVADAEVEHAYLVEVKLRRRFDAETARELYATLRQQCEHWPQAYAVITLAEPMVPEGRFHQDYIRVLPLKTNEKLINPYYDRPLRTSTDRRPITVNDFLEMMPDESVRMACVWDHLAQLQDVFRYFHQGKGNEQRGGQGQRNADFVTAALRDLRNLG